MKNSQIITNIIGQIGEQERVYSTYSEFAARVNEIKKRFKIGSSNCDYDLVEKVKIAFNPDAINALTDSQIFLDWSSSGVQTSYGFGFVGSVYVALDHESSMKPVYIKIKDSSPYVNVLLLDDSTLPMASECVTGEFTFYCYNRKQL